MNALVFRLVKVVVKVIGPLNSDQEDRLRNEFQAIFSEKKQRKITNRSPK